MLLARLGGAETHRLGDLRPGQPSGSGREQQPGLDALDFGPGRRKESERVEQVVGVEVLGAPQRELRQLDSRGRYRFRPPRAGGQPISTERDSLKAAVKLTI